MPYSSAKRPPVRVFLAHPELQHSAQLAAALSAGHMLAMYTHGAAVPATVIGDIPSDQRQRVHWFQLLRRLASRTLSPLAMQRVYPVLFDVFDRQIARQLSRRSFDAVIGYESCSLHTFERAKALGVSCILDAANIHPLQQMKWLKSSNTPAAIKIKQREIALADLIITCSTLARESYIDAGVAADKVVAVPLGVDTNVFDTQVKRPPTRRTSPALTFCNAGLIDHRKGMDLLISACRRMREKGIDFKLLVVGNRHVADQALVASLAQVADIRPRVAQHELSRLFAEADVFVLPSRFDSFGMVVTEALACGLPVIVSDNVGAKDLVRDGVNGWVIPTADADALAARMIWCAENVDDVRKMGPAARATAEQWNWTDYRRRVASVIGDFLAARPV